MRVTDIPAGDYCFLDHLLSTAWKVSPSTSLETKDYATCYSRMFSALSPPARAQSFSWSC